MMTNKDRDKQIAILYGEGCSKAEIGRCFGLSDTSVSRIINKSTRLHKNSVELDVFLELSAFSRKAILLAIARKTGLKQGGFSSVTVSDVADVWPFEGVKGFGRKRRKEVFVWLVKHGHRPKSWSGEKKEILDDVWNDAVNMAANICFEGAASEAGEIGSRTSTKLLSVSKEILGLLR